MESPCCELPKQEMVFPAAWGAAAVPLGFGLCCRVVVQAPWVAGYHHSIIRIDTPWITIAEKAGIKKNKAREVPARMGTPRVSPWSQPAQNSRRDTINPTIYMTLNSAHIFSNTEPWVLLTASLIITFFDIYHAVVPSLLKCRGEQGSLHPVEALLMRRCHWSRQPRIKKDDPSLRRLGAQLTTVLDPRVQNIPCGPQAASVRWKSEGGLWFWGSPRKAFSCNSVLTGQPQQHFVYVISSYRKRGGLRESSLNRWKH